MSQQTRGRPYRPRSNKIKKYRAYFISLLDRIPPVKRAVRRVWYDTALLRQKMKWATMKKKHSAELDIDKIYWVEPDRIEYASLTEFNIYEDKGAIIGGDWDLLEKRFEDLDVYLAFQQRFKEGKQWEDTLFYQRILKRIAGGELAWGRNKTDFDRRCQFLDALYQNIKNKGYKARSELLSEEEFRHPLMIEDEITVNVGRGGDLLFNNGAHRLSIAKVLGIKKIPVKITVRHTQWESLRGQILSYAQENGGRIYSPITHPDLQYIPAVHDLEYDRFSIIKENLSAKEGRLLDIGAHWGYFCHKFEQIGFDCYAIESARVNLYFLEKLRRAGNRHFTIIPKSIFEYQGVKELNFDVVLALNIFHHFLKNETSYLNLLALLKNLKMKEMYFEPHLPRESQMEGAYKNYSEKEFVEFVLQASKLNEVKLIGIARDGRKIYKLF